jgi:ribosome-associated protein
MSTPSAIQVTSSVSIPLDELRFEFTRSSGPGGQHVNKAATQVELVFDVGQSPSLTDEQRRRVLAALRPLINREGVLRLTCQSSRSQVRNREEVVERFQAILSRALFVAKQRRRTRPTRASAARRLVEKKEQSQRKSERRFRPDEG